jgi:broad specificity phosphatase PhoE
VRLTNYAAWCKDWQHATPTNGESFQAFTQRIADFAASLGQYQQRANLLIVGHQGFRHWSAWRVASLCTRQRSSAGLLFADRDGDAFPRTLPPA